MWLGNATSAASLVSTRPFPVLRGFTQPRLPDSPLHTASISNIPERDAHVELSSYFLDTTVTPLRRGAVLLSFARAAWLWLRDGISGRAFACWRDRTDRRLPPPARCDRHPIAISGCLPAAPRISERCGDPRNRAYAYLFLTPPYRRRILRKRLGRAQILFREDNRDPFSASTGERSLPSRRCGAASESHRRTNGRAERRRRSF